MPWEKREALIEKGDPEMELKAKVHEPLGPGFAKELIAKADFLVIDKNVAAKKVLSRNYRLFKKVDGGLKKLAEKRVEY